MGLAEDVRAAMASAVEPGSAELVSADYCGVCFGNAVTVVRLGDILVRVVKDRDTVHCELGTEQAADEWWLAEDVFAVLHIKSDVCSRGFFEALTSLLRAVQSNTDALSFAFGAERMDETRELLHRLAVERVNRMFPSLRNPKP